MKQFIEILTFVIIGCVLVWVGFKLFSKLGVRIGGSGSKKRRDEETDIEGAPGDAKTCPVCSAKLSKGQLVSSAAFPSTNGGKDRFMHIRGCVNCLNGARKRVCPVCGIVLEPGEILIARLFERPGRRNHIHIIGCTQCKKGPR